ncbi:MAG: tetratricopeptide repeat protein [Balneolaceae bacterium]|nr:tetratricopeptide repeat protein [Balneolaceae bacterium]
MFRKKSSLLLVLCLVLPLALQAQDSTSSSANSEGKAHAAYIKGLEEFENENYERALDHLSTAYMDLPKHAGVNYALADAYLAIDDLSNAAYYGKKAAELEPQNKWYHLQLANIYRRAGRNQATIDQLKLALKYHPNATDVMSELANVYSQHEQYLESNKIYTQLLNKTGPDIGIYLQKLQKFQRPGYAGFGHRAAEENTRAGSR